MPLAHTVFVRRARRNFLLGRWFRSKRSCRDVRFGFSGSNLRLYARVYMRDLYQFGWTHHSQAGAQEVAFVSRFRAQMDKNRSMTPRRARSERQVSPSPMRPVAGGIHAEWILQGFSGILQVDGYAGYNRLIAPARVGRRPRGVVRSSNVDSMENLLVALPWNVDYRSGDGRQCGGRTPVTSNPSADSIIRSRLSFPTNSRQSPLPCSHNVLQLGQNPSFEPTGPSHEATLSPLRWRS